MKQLVFDTEAILDPAVPYVPRGETKPDFLPSVSHWQVVALGCMMFGSSTSAKNPSVRIYTPERLGCIEGNEFDVLAKFADMFANSEGAPRMVTFNGRGFDLPLIVARCFHHGIAWLYYYNTRDVRYRYSADRHLDLMDYLADHGATRASRLDAWAKLCGFPGKVGVDGSEVAKLVAEGQLEAVKNYCLCDVVQTAAVFLRFERLRGHLTVEGYRESAQLLLDFIADDARIKPVFEQVDRERFLL